MTRNAIFAGRWYPAEPDQLDELVNWKPEEGGKARIAILPHAGLYFSHRGIAHFFSRMEDGVDRIIILSPSHYYYLRPDRILTADYDAYRTPYGVLEGKPLKGFDTGGEAEIQQEHAVEMVLPFIAKKGRNRRLERIDQPGLRSRAACRDDSLADGRTHRFDRQQ